MPKLSMNLQRKRYIIIFTILSLLPDPYHSLPGRFYNDQRRAGKKGRLIEMSTSKSDHTTTELWGIDSRYYDQDLDSMGSKLVSSRDSSDKAFAKCQPLTIPMCKGLGYNMTSAEPNMFNHENQAEAGLEVHQFWPLVEIRCSPELRLLLCSLYAPICVEGYHKPSLPVCRSVCERARAGCGPLMRQFGFAWPARMDCNILPLGPSSPSASFQSGELCLDLSMISNSKTKVDHNDKKVYQANESVNWKDNSASVFRPKNSVKVAKEINLDTWYDTSNVDRRHTNKFSRKSFSEEERNTAIFWVRVWAIACLIATLITLATFLVEPSRFTYPQRPVVYLALCYLFISIGYILPVFLGPSNDLKSSSTRSNHSDVVLMHNASQDSETSYIYETPNTLKCYAEFGLIYYFGMASYAWWIILTLTWFLAAGMKWTEEGLTRVAPYFHGLAWSLPSVQVFAVFILNAMDYDDLYGICSVGRVNVTHLKVLVIYPMAGYLLIGTIFLLTGLGAMMRLKSVLKGWKEMDRLDLLIRRVGVYAVCYTVPALTVLACYVYESIYRTPSNSGCYTEDCEDSAGVPFWVYATRYFMDLSIGTVTAGVWVCSGKTLTTWRRYMRKTFVPPERLRTKKECLASTQRKPLLTDSPSLKDIIVRSRDSNKFQSGVDTMIVPKIPRTKIKGLGKKFSIISGIEPVKVGGNVLHDKSFSITSASQSDRTRSTRVNLLSGSSCKHDSSSA